MSERAGNEFFHGAFPDWSGPVRISLHTGTPDEPTAVPVSMRLVEDEGTIMERRTYVPVEPTVLQNGDTVTFVLHPADDAEVGEQS